MEASNPEYVWNSGTETSMSDAFNRLRWSIFEDISNIRVADNLKLLPFDDHPIATEAATKIPLKEIAFTLDVLDNYESDGFEAPDRLLVRRADGGIITVADVVEQLSAYFIAHKEEILEAKAPFLPWDDLSNTRVFFDGFTFPIEPGIYSLPVDLWAEGEDGDGEFADHWSHGA